MSISRGYRPRGAAADVPGTRSRRRVWLAAALGALTLGCIYSRHSVVTPDATGLFVEMRGEGARTLVVPLASRFGPYLETPPAEDVRLVLYDPRARGASDFPRFHHVGLRKDVQDMQVLMRTKELDRVVIVGWWYTAAVAAHYALQHPERVEALILLAPLPIRRWPHVRDTDLAIQARAGAAELAALEQRALGAEGETAEFCRELHAATLRVLLHDPALAAAADASHCEWENERASRIIGLHQDVFERLGDWDWRSRLKDVPVPVLVVHGASDPTPLASAEDWVDTLPRARLEVIEDMGRMPWIEASAELNAAIERFLDEVALPR